MAFLPINRRGSTNISSRERLVSPLLFEVFEVLGVTITLSSTRSAGKRGGFWKRVGH